MARQTTRVTDRYGAPLTAAPSLLDTASMDVALGSGTPGTSVPSSDLHWHLEIHSIAVWFERSALINV